MKISRRPLHLSYDAGRDVLVAAAYGSVPQPRLPDHTYGLTCWFSFLLRRPNGKVIGFLVDGLSELDVHDHDPTLWGRPTFHVPTLGLRDASVGEIVLRARTQLAGTSTPDVLAHEAAREHLLAGDHRAAEREFRAALATGDLHAHVTLAACLVQQGRYAEAYDHARVYSELAPTDSWGWAWLGRAALELDDAGEATTALERAVRLERDGSFRTPAKRLLRTLRAADDIPF